MDVQFPQTMKYILLCDDEVSILRAAEFKLKRAGYEVETAGDGEAGWAAIQARKPDLLITDCQMPRLNGLDLIRRLRSHAETADLTVLMLTAKGLELSHEALNRELGIRRIIAKPFSPRQLLEEVDAAFSGNHDTGIEVQGNTSYYPRECRPGALGDFSEAQ
jgi:two-component system, OmpR family, alkaline phosphatase synthesis response regulator PhoP